MVCYLNHKQLYMLTIFYFITNGKSLKLFYKNQWIKHGNNNSATYNLKIGPRGSFSTYDLFPRPFQKMCNAYWQISNFPLFPLLTNHPPIIEKSVWQSFKSKNIKATIFSFFHASRHGRHVFYPNQIYVGPIWLLKWSILAFSEKLKSLKLIFKNPWVKNPKIQILLHTICRLVQDNHFAPRTFFLCRSKSGLIFWSHLIRKWSLIFFKKAIRSKRSLKIPPPKKSFQQSWRHPSWRTWTEGQFACNPSFIWPPKIHAT